MCLQNLMDVDGRSSSEGGPAGEEFKQLRHRVVDMEADHVEVFNTMEDVLTRVEALEIANDAADDNTEDDEDTKDDEDSDDHDDPDDQRLIDLEVRPASPSSLCPVCRTYVLPDPPAPSRLVSWQFTISDWLSTEFDPYCDPTGITLLV